MKELRLLKKDGISADELRRSKDHLKGNLMLSLESTSSRMNRLARQEMRFGSFLSIDEMLAAIDGVRPEEVEALLHRILDEEQLSLLALGPIERGDLPRESLLRCLGGRRARDRALQRGPRWRASGPRTPSTRPGSGSSWRCARSMPAAA